MEAYTQTHVVSVHLNYYRFAAMQISSGHTRIAQIKSERGASRNAEIKAQAMPRVSRLPLGCNRPLTPLFLSFFVLAKYDEH